MTSSRKRRASRGNAGTAGGIAAVYLIVSVLWIVLTDLAVRLFPDISDLVQTVKGLFFVVASALLLYVLIRRGQRRLQATERQAREELRFQHDVLAQVSDAVAYVGLDGRLLYANSSALRLYGIEPGGTGELLGRPFTDVVDFDWIDREDEGRCRAALGSEGRWRGEVLLKTRSRKRLVLDCDITLVEDEAGRQAGALAIARDVTKHRRAEEKLRRSEERLALHFEQVPLAAIEWDENAGVRRWNKAAERIFGYAKAEMLGRNDWERLVPEEDREQVRAVFQGLLEQGESTPSTNRNITKDGRVIICEWLNTPLVGEDGRPIGAASLASDITDRLTDQEKLQESNRLQRLLLSELDHRVKNALSGLITMVDLTRERTTTVEAFGAAVARRVEAMARVHSMLSESRWSSLHIREVIGSMRPPESPGRLSLDGPDVLIPVRQATPLGMVIQELMSNSLKHGALASPGGRVEIRWEADGAERDGSRSELRIAWSESGGPPINGNPQLGLGTSLVEGFCRFELGGDVEFDFRPEGVRHRIRVLLDPSSERDHAAERQARRATE
jgi:PAS domain S-box-containing protein